jgi:hypothetical protein
MHSLKSHHDGFGGGGKSVTRTPFKKNKTVNDDFIKTCNVNVRTETTFRDFSSSQPQWNGQVG